MASKSSDPVVSFRFEHVQNADGHHVIVGREGKLLRCEDEPIRVPGAVQGYGVLIAVEEDENLGNLVVRQVSENAAELLGLSPKYLFGLECFTDTLPEGQADLLWDIIQFLRDPVSEGDEGTQDNSPQVFLLRGWGEPGSAVFENDETIVEEKNLDRRLWTCWCAAHRPPYTPPDVFGSGASNSGSSSASTTPHPSLVILELELERDHFNPLYPVFANHEMTSSGSSSASETGSSEDLRHKFTNPSHSTTPGSSSSTGATGSDSDTMSGGSQTTQTTPTGARGSDSETPTVQQDTAASANVLTKSTSSGKFGLNGPDDWTPPASGILESVTSRSKPIRALERMRRSRQGTTAARTGKGGRFKRGSKEVTGGRASGKGAVGTMDVFSVLTEINDQLSSAPDLDTLLNVVVGVMKDLTQFHRVMVYQFDEHWNGQVVAELVDWNLTNDLYKGLHFPASDIPAQVRHNSVLHKVRILYDRSQMTARLVARRKKDLDTPLDMTHSYLRAMSPIHLKCMYLGNMDVRASMSISIVTFGALWGMIVCHSYGHSGMRVSFPVRQMLRLLSDSISRNIERLSYAKRLHTRKLISTLPTDEHPTGYIVSNAEDLLGIFDADYGVLVIGEGAKILGPNLHGQEVLIVAEYLRLKQFNLIQVSQAVTKDFPDLSLPTGLEIIAGLLYVPLSSGGKDFIAFLRKGQLREVHWAGKPFKDVPEENTTSLEPRKSFKLWSETILGRCRVWTDEQLETAGVLALVYGKFIEVWREKESALQTTQLTNLLLSNAIRTPLNHIINYLEMALNGPLDGETRENLTRSHIASKSLLFTINDLLDLTRLESGQETFFNEPFDLKSTISDAVHLYRGEAMRRNLGFEIDVSDCPDTVVGDARKIRTVVANLTANAVKFTSKGKVWITCHTFKEPQGLRSLSEVVVEIIVGDTGCGIPNAKLESIFRDFEQVESAGPRPGQTGLGLGLAVVARIVEQLGGQLRVDSKLDKGSKFSFLIPFSLIKEDSASSASRSGSSVSSSRPSNRLSSDESVSHKIDDLFDAISSDHMATPGTPARQVPRSSSRRSRKNNAAVGEHGEFHVEGSKYPVRSIKMDESKLDQKRSASAPPPVNPEISPPPVATSTSTTPPDTPADTEDMRILIVEDETINRTILRKRLTLDGHEVVGTTNGQEGVDMIEKDRDFDCVLMDIQMPILNGFEATKRIRQIEKEQPSTSTTRKSIYLNGRIPIFAVSASLQEKQRDDMFALGMDGWVLKPIDFKRLRVLIQGIHVPEERQRNVYRPGYSWEAGGWLADARAHLLPAPVSLSSPEKSPSSRKSSPPSDPPSEA
ncbi:hypothetical protein SISNIDRAFT_415403 [Sistotremastrum niveocremeum HHB9708]|uniref:Cyanobacterial phytochrome B n=1 Tax=Sistotremastrum niveocremeum HHB9708 TaxID=1314777 RepID=A0A164RC78_9AGAM|nr:hypothetical protein SISNIDRAFT_415403 [Sistotremastrum niveocremeum HHB9708]